MSRHMFHYRARTSAGERIAGSMEADGANAVLAHLHQRMLFVTGLERERRIGGIAPPWPGGRASPRALRAFTRAFATMLRAGIPMQRALTVSAERSTDSAMREALGAVSAAITHGSSLTDALSQQSRIFRPLYVALVRAGERGGILDDVLHRLAAILEREAEVGRRLRAALTYPAIVLCGAALVLFFLMTHVLPMFEEMFRSFAVPLPPLTRALLGTGAALRHPLFGTTALLFALAALAAAGSLHRHAPARLTADALRLRLPVAGNLLRKLITERTVRTLADLVRSGVDLLAALEVVRPIAGSAYGAALGRCATALRSGDTLTTALEREPLFDALTVALVRAGEEAGVLDEMLAAAARSCAAEAEAALATLGASLEPVLLGLLGAAVAFIVFSVFIPLYTLVGSISK